MTTKPVVEIMVRGMSASKAWPAVFAAGSAYDLAQASVAALAAAGYAIVPKEPSEKMLRAVDTMLGEDGACWVWSAMLAAAAAEDRP